MAGKAEGIRAAQAYVEISAELSKLQQGLNQATAAIQRWHGQVTAWATKSTASLGSRISGALANVRSATQSAFESVHKSLQSVSEELDKFGKSVTDVGKNLIGLGTAATMSLIGAAKVFADAGDEIQKMALRTGMSAEALSELKYAADSSGTSLADVEKGIRNMQRNITEGATGTVEALASLGLTLDQLRGMSPEDQFTAIGDALAKIEDPATRAAIAMQIFGRSGTALLPMFEEGAHTISELRARARELGLTMSGEEANAAAAFDDALTDLYYSLRRVVIAIGSQLAPMLSNLVQRIIACTGSVVDFIRQHQTLIETLLKVSVAAIAAGAAILALGQALRVISTGISIVNALITVASTVFSTILGLLSSLMSPLGMIIAALATAGAMALYFSGAWKSVLEWFGGALKWLGEVFGEAWQGIRDAIAAGDLGLAFKIAVAAVKVIWFEALAWLMQKWVDFKTMLIEGWYGFTYGFASMLLTGVRGAQAIWVSFQVMVQKMWARTVKFLQDAWDGVYYALAKAFTNLSHLFSSAEERARAVGALDEEQAKRAEERQRNLQKRIQEIEKEGADKQAEIGKKLTDEQKALEEDKKRAIEAGTQGLQGSVDELRKKEEEARKELDKLVGEAEEKRKEKEAAGPKPLPEMPEVPKPPSPKDFQEQVERQIKLTSAGTFSALAARGLGMSGPLEKIARATEATAENTKRLIKAVEEDEAVFA